MNRIQLNPTGKIHYAYLDPSYITICGLALPKNIKGVKKAADCINCKKGKPERDKIKKFYKEIYKDV